MRADTEVGHSSFWNWALKEAIKEWEESCERKDSFKKRMMYLNRLNNVIGNLVSVTKKNLQKGKEQSLCFKLMGKELHELDDWETQQYFQQVQAIEKESGLS